MAGLPSTEVGLATASLANVASVAPRPSLCMKPLTSATSPAPNAGSPTASLTSKEWVIPPRPKPGRKPATDTPPTKRKAQNRAAQRAFRERRAARVSELEDQIKQTEDEHEQQQESLQAQIIRLEQEVETYRNQLTTWMDKYRQLEKDFAEARSVRRSESSPNLREHQPLDPSDDHGLGCGNCTLDTACQCIDDAVAALRGEGSDLSRPQAEKRPPSPDRRANEKRIKHEPVESMEIDFTTLYSRPRNPTARAEAISPSSAVADPCGFCQDGTPCICAEMAAEQERQAVGTSLSVRQLAQFTPPPSDGDVGPLSLNPPSLRRAVLGPGTCAQCRADPNSTLFCKSLAASRAQAGLPSGCCGGKSAEGGCCLDPVPPPPRSTRSKSLLDKVQLPPLQVPKSSITLSCADAYTTLSRHPAYERASDDIANWMPKLHASSNVVEGRPALEIDAANVMAVLRDFDRRFGAEK